ncbi:MAG: CDP-alcohol phosphatidyltransferase family protein [Bacteroidales bacterium]|nr:CDP-alcohol phosphatidyltransferase family protein [Bacteroidales bacterium]
MTKELNIGSTPVPNIITIFRAIGALGLLFFGVEGIAFWVIYLACGISDMIDGALARKYHCESKTGALLDSLADIVFVVCCCIKLIPVLALPNWLWIWVLVIAFIKVINQISALVIYKKCVFPHTIANKVTGFLLFVGIPVTFFVESLIPIIIVAIFATFAAIQEGHLIRTKKI